MGRAPFIFADEVELCAELPDFVTLNRISPKNVPAGPMPWLPCGKPSLTGAATKPENTYSEDTVYDYKFVGLSHNTVRGAAGGAVLCAETLKAKGYITKK